MTPKEALELIQNSLLATLPREKLKQHNEAFETIRRLVVDEIARRANADTDRLEKR